MSRRYCTNCPALQGLLYPITLPRGTKLSQSEQGQIMVMNNTGMTPADVARCLKRSPKADSRFFKNPAACNANKLSGRLSKLPSRDKRRITRELALEGSSCMQLKRILELYASKFTIWREIRSQTFFRYMKRNHAWMIKSWHKTHRVQ